MPVAHHHAVHAVLPPDLGIAEVEFAVPFRQVGMADHGVEQRLFKILAVADSHALRLGFPAEGARGLHAGIHQHQLPVRRFHRAAGKASARVRGRIGGQGAGHIGPVQKIIADRVAPMHRAPLPGEGMILAEQMVLPFVPAEPVGIVHPSHQRRQVKKGPFVGRQLHRLLPFKLSYPVQGRGIFAHGNLLCCGCSETGSRITGPRQKMLEYYLAAT